MDLGFHLAMSYRNLKHPTSRKNFAAVVGQNHALVLTQCLNQKAAPINLPLILIYRKFAISSLRTAFASGKLSLMLAVPKLDQNWISRY